MRKTLVVAMREFLAAIRTKTFVITLVAMPVLMGGSILVQMLLKDRVDTADKTIVVVDLTGQQLGDAIVKASQKRDRTDVYEGKGDDRRKIKPRFIIEVESAESLGVAYDPDADPDADATATAKEAEMALVLSERVRKKEIFAFLIIPKGVIHPPEGGEAPPVAYHSNNPTYTDFQRWVRPVVRSCVQQLRFSEVGLDSALVYQALEEVPMENMELVSRDASGKIQPARKSNQVANILVPLGTMMLMFMVIMIGAQPLVQGVLEEKMQRIAEVLVSSVSPFQLMMGKLLGTVAVSLVIVTVYMLGGYQALSSAGYARFFPGHLVPWFAVYQCLAVLMFGSIFIAIGAAVNDLKEAQNIMTPTMIIVILPFFLWMNVLREPNAPFSVIVSLFPPATPMLMTIRQAVPPGIPTWQPLLGVVLVLATTVVCVFAAGRIFRIGLLMQGKAPKIREILKWAIKG